MEQQSKKKRIKCEVVSDKMNKSRVGKTVRLVKHPEAGKYIKRTSKIMFHDEQNATKIGDNVLIEECNPRSARKSFRLVEIVQNI
jgi:small subunit ribosomal protein S17